MTTNQTGQGLTGLTVNLLVSFLSRNNVRVDEMAGLISSTYTALAELPTRQQSRDVADVYLPAVSPQKSLANRNFIVSLIDGKPYKSLKRHLRGNGMTPEEYRARYKLPANYPMVAPAYSDTRREVAKRFRLGRLPRPHDRPSGQKADGRPEASNDTHA